MNHRVARNFGVARAISLGLLLLGSAALTYSVYQVVAGHTAFSWVWLMSLLPAAYGAYLFGSFAVKGHVPLAMPADASAETEGAG